MDEFGDKESSNRSMTSDEMGQYRNLRIPAEVLQNGQENEESCGPIRTSNEDNRITGGQWG